MALSNNYIAQRPSDAKLAARDLDQAIQTKVEGLITDQDLVTVKTAVLRDGVLISNGVAFEAPNESIQGGLRYYSPGVGSEYRLEYYQGGEWIALAENTLIWNSSTQYNAGDVVFYKVTGGWYRALTSVTGVLNPPTTDNWQLLTLGTVISYVKSANAFATAITTATTLVIQGDIASDNMGTLILRPSRPNVTIYSDEASSIQCSLNFIPLNPGTNVYWHSNGTRFTSNATSIVMATGSNLWIERCTTATSIGCPANVYYQRVDGAGITGGTHAVWVDSIGAPLVPRDLTTEGLAPVAGLTADAKIYVDQNPSGTYDASNTGYATLATLSSAIAPTAIRYFRVDGQGTLAERPIATSSSPIPQGYVYNATDEGTIYIYQPDVYLEPGWSPSIRITGPQGIQGVPGPAGPANQLSVTATETLAPGADAYVEIAGQSPAQALTFHIPRGSQGVPGPANNFTVLDTVTVGPDIPAEVRITGTPPDLSIQFWIPRGAPGNSGPNGYTAVPSISDAGDLSWSVSQLSTPPLVPATRNIIGPQGATGPQGKSMYDIWIDAGNTGTQADFIASLGIGDRYMSFTQASVGQNKTVVFSTEYPVVSIVSPAGTCYAVPTEKTTYSRNTTPKTATINLDWLYKTLDLDLRNARITINPDPGLGAAGAMVFTYSDAVTVDGTAYYRWASVDNVYVYTDTNSITVGTTVAYTQPGDVGSWSGTITGYSAGHGDIGLEGTWYVAFGGGGGDASFVTAVEYAQGLSYMMYPGKVVRWILTGNSTLDAFGLNAGLYGTSMLYVRTSTYTLSPGSNMTFLDELSSGLNICEISWYDGAATLSVLDVVPDGEV